MAKRTKAQKRVSLEEKSPISISRESSGVKKLKIAVYTICKNEEQFVDRFMDSALEADAVYVLDTGSTDNTVEKLKARGAIVRVQEYKPWRFDTPRNDNMDDVPEDFDYCVSFDMDEFFEKGWRANLEKFLNENKGVDQVTYLYSWNHYEDGRNKNTFCYDKIHTRKNYRWIKAVHEILDFSGGRPEVQAFCNSIHAHHFADDTKSRGNYLPLLKLSVDEDPNDLRNLFYYARELMFYKKSEEAIEYFQKYLDHPDSNWKYERAFAWYFCAKCYGNLGNKQKYEEALLNALREDKNVKEVLKSLAFFYFEGKDYLSCFYYAERAIACNRRFIYLEEADAWDEGLAEDCSGAAAWHLGFRKKALERYKEALEKEPENNRFIENIKWLEKTLGEDLIKAYLG